MSLILDALNRSRQEADPVPGLGTRHPVAPRNPLWRLLPWVALAVALAVIAWLLFGRAQPAPTQPVAELSRNVSSALNSVKSELRARAQQPAEVVAAQPSAPAASRETAAAAQSRALPPTATPGPSPIPGAAPTPGPASTPASTPGQASSPAPAPVAASSQARPDPSADAVAQLYQRAAGTARQQEEARETPSRSPEGAGREVAPAAQSAAGATGESEEEPVDIEDILLRAREEMHTERLVEHPAPFIAELSQQAKDEIPTIFYRQHDYSDNAAQSRVILNNKTLAVGGSPAPGLKIDEILPDSVVLSFRGRQFRLRALNSWVNL
ncbi:MAG: hypothetical protein CME59_10415 [Halioglobus sp.]|nr:hypothetical protein [Halioglobus sp.]|tara:strand:- start:2041 stop:3015 length:975 start_codon:yes stop_codon:yes gene_type:complete